MVDLDSPSLEEGFESTIVPLESFLSTNLKTITELQESTRNLLVDLLKGKKEELGHQDLEWTRIDNSMGDCEEDLGTLTLFETVGMFNKDSSILTELQEHMMCGGVGVCQQAWNGMGAMT